MADEIITKRIKEAMKFRDVTAAELCRRTGLNKAAISRYLSGRYTPKQNAIGAIAEALNVNPIWLLGYDVEMLDNIRPDMVIENQDDTYVVEFKKLNSANQEAVKKYIEFLIKSQGE